MCRKTREGDLVCDFLCVSFKSRHSSSSAVWEYHPVIPFGDGPHPDFWFPSCSVVSIWTLNRRLVSENCERVEQLETKCAVLIFKSVESPSFDFSFFFLDAINKTCGEKTSGVERAMTDGRCLTCRLINFTTVRLKKHHVCSSTSVKRLETVQPRLKEKKVSCLLTFSAASCYLLLHLFLQAGASAWVQPTSSTAGGCSWWCVRCRASPPWSLSRLCPRALASSWR